MLPAAQPVTVALVPWNATVLLPWLAPKLVVPVIVTGVPTGPDVTDRLVMVGRVQRPPSPQLQPFANPHTCAATRDTAGERIACWPPRLTQKSTTRRLSGTGP